MPCPVLDRVKIRYIFSSAFEDFRGGQKLRQLYPKQGTYFHLLSSALVGAPLPPPLQVSSQFPHPELGSVLS